MRRWRNSNIRNGLLYLVWLACFPVMAFGMAAFLLGDQQGTSDYDYTRTLTEPQPICAGAEVEALDGRICVFSEELCAVNVYGEDGAFLFCVRGNRAQNGGASFAQTEDGLYLRSRNHILYYFDWTGAYRGRAENGTLYNADGTVREAYEGEMVLFVDEYYCVSRYDPMGERDEYYFHGYGEERYVGAVEEFVREGETQPEGARYFTVLGRLYRRQEGKTTLLARTPLYLTVWYSSFLPWGLVFAAGLGIRQLPKVIVPRKSREETEAEP